MHNSESNWHCKDIVYCLSKNFETCTSRKAIDIANTLSMFVEELWWSAVVTYGKDITNGWNKFSLTYGRCLFRNIYGTIYQLSDCTQAKLDLCPGALSGSWFTDLINCIHSIQYISTAWTKIRSDAGWRSKDGEINSISLFPHATFAPVKRPDNPNHVTIKTSLEWDSNVTYVHFSVSKRITSKQLIYTFWIHVWTDLCISWETSVVW